MQNVLIMIMVISFVFEIILCYFYLLELDSLSTKRVRHSVTCLLDLPNEIFLLMCRYLSCVDVLYAFYTPHIPNRLHCIIGDYYKKVKLIGLSNSEFVYLSNLFCNAKSPLRPESLILSNECISGLTQRFFTNIYS
jgi:hypothetical protein